MQRPGNHPPHRPSPTPSGLNGLGDLGDLGDLAADAVGRALFAQDRIGLVVFDRVLRVQASNVSSDVFGGLTFPPGASAAEVLLGAHSDAAADLRHVWVSGESVVGIERRFRPAGPLGPDLYLSITAIRLKDPEGQPLGVLMAFTDITERFRSQLRLDLLHDASSTLGRSLDVVKSAQQLADLMVPRLADMAMVQLGEAVFEGEDPPKIHGGGELYLRRAAVAHVEPLPQYLVQVGESLPPMPDTPLLRNLQRGITDFIPDIIAAGILPSEPGPWRSIHPTEAHSVIVAPLFARGRLLGNVELWRTKQPAPFDQDDADLVGEIASRAALSVDNARRYAREHRATVALQQSLLPSTATETTAATTFGAYQPTSSGSGVGGDWFDVIPLPSLRVAFAVGDVVGHGLHASATMGRLRTAVQTLADLDPSPDELLIHLDDLVLRLAEGPDDQRADVSGATCLYAVYDPVTRRCVMASAGHPPPVVVSPDGTASFVELSASPPLGIGGMPFEVAEVDLEPGSVLALYTNGLIEGEHHDLERGMDRLRTRLQRSCLQHRGLDTLGHDILADLVPKPTADDATLLLAKVRDIPEQDTVSWDIPADPTFVAKVRELTSRQLHAWGLGDLAFSTELLASELVTNAIRYGGEPITLRLTRNGVLVCEVSDASSTQPRLRRAHVTDEGGRGLFLVAQVAARWGCRYNAVGKTIWAEQPIPSLTDVS